MQSSSQIVTILPRQQIRLWPPHLAWSLTLTVPVVAVRLESKGQSQKVKISYSPKDLQALVCFLKKVDAVLLELPSVL